MANKLTTTTATESGSPISSSTILADHTTDTQNSKFDSADSPVTFLEEPWPDSSAPRRSSSVGKIVDAIKKPFSKEKKETPPALKENIEQMEKRKEEKRLQMQEEGLDTSMLEGSTRGRLKQTLR